jgi:hypothetical protein
MEIMRGTRALLVICLALSVAISARAAGTYTLTCDASRSGSFTLTLTGFNMVVTGSSEPGTGAAAGKRDSKFELTINFDSGKDYGALLSMLQDGTTASENWTQEAVTKGKNKNKNNAPASTTGGALEWILTNATITSVTATGSESATGAPQGSMQATLEAQTFSFAD